MKHQAFFPRKIKVKKMKCGLLQFSFGTLRVKMSYTAELFFIRHPRLCSKRTLVSKLIFPLERLTLGASQLWSPHCVK